MNNVRISDVVLKEETADPRKLFPDKSFKYVDITSVNNNYGKIILETVKNIESKNAPSRARKIIHKDNVIVSTVRPNLNATAIIPSELDEQICSTGFAVLKCKNIILPKYLYFISRSPFFVSELIKRAKGASYPAVSVNDVLDVIIPLPAIAVQKQIIVILERAEKLKELRQRANEETNQIIQAIFYEMFGDPIKNEKNYPIKPLVDICHKITDGTHVTPYYVESGIPFLRVTDLTNSNESKKFISEEEHKELIRRCKPEKNDILYSKNGTIGIAKLIDWDYEFSIFVSLCLIKPQEATVLPKYLEVFLNTPFALSQALSHSKKGTITNLHLIEIKKILVPIPSIRDQEEFLRKVDKINGIHRRQSKAAEEINTLFDALMQKAFNGELVSA